MNHSSNQTDRGRVLAKAVRDAGSALGLPDPEIAEVIGLDAPSVPDEIAPDSGPGQVSILLVRLFTNLDTMVNGVPESVRGWMQSEHRDLGRRPIEEVHRAGGLARLVEYLEGYRDRR